MRRFFISTLLLMFTLVVFCQNTIQGKVIDEEGVPVSGANVYIKELSKGQMTLNDGSFILENLQGKKYLIQVSHVGFETRVISINTPSVLNIVLQKRVIEIGEVTVSATRATQESAVAYADVKKEAIEAKNLGQDIPYLLSSTPSYITTSDAGTGIGYTGFRIRGTDANRVNITVNGVPLNDAESHGTFFVNMPDFASSLSSVQVQRGVGTSTNGAAAFGASVNMQTEILNSVPYAELSSTYGSFNTNKNSVKVGTGLLANRFAVDARLSNVSSDGYIDRAWVKMQSYMLGVGYYAPKTKLRFITFGGKERTYQAWNGVDSTKLDNNRTYNELGEYTDKDENLRFYDNQTDNYWQRHYQLHFLQQISEQLHFNATAHLTRGYGYYEEYLKGRKYVEYGLQSWTPDSTTTDLIRQKWLDNYFYGLTYSLNYNTSKYKGVLGGAVNRYTGEHFGKVIWARNAFQLDPNHEWYRSHSIKDDANIYLKSTYEMIDHLFVYADLQYRYILHQMNGLSDKFDSENSIMRPLNESLPFHFFNPKFGLTYKITNFSDVYASYSISNREPSRSNYIEAGPNEKPASERLYDTEIGYRYHNEDTYVGVNLYYMKYKNQLILTGKISEIGELLTSNIKDSYRAGVELSAGHRFTKWFKWDGNVALSQNKILNFIEEGVDQYDSDWNWIGAQDNVLGETDIAYSPNVIANNVFTLNFSNFEVNLFSNYVGKQYYDNTSDENRSIQAYFVNNLSVKYDLKVARMKGIELKFLVNNLLNEQYETNAYKWYSYYMDGNRINEARYFPQAGINYLASVTLKL